MVRPAAIGSNAETIASNAFQRELSADEVVAAKERALVQFDHAVETLRAEGVDVLVIPDKAEPARPDAVFPNNWFSTHEDGRIVLYPMLAPSRRTERRPEIVELLKERVGYWDVVDYTPYEEEGKFLEGTGSLVLDRVNRIAFACESPRTHPEVVTRFCADFGYRQAMFAAADMNGKAIYHTNVMIAITSDFAFVCMEAIGDENHRMLVDRELDQSGRKTIRLTFDEMHGYCGNVLEVQTQRGEKRLVMSSTAWLNFRPKIKEIILDKVKPLLLQVGAIQDLGGGSARCMIAELFTPAPKPEPVAAGSAPESSDLPPL